MDFTIIIKLLFLYELESRLCNSYFIFNEIEKKTKDYVYLDYYDLYFEHDEYFKDSDHMNGKGANIFSGIVSQDLKRVT
ncbi:MAG: hypothetical protein ACI83O_000086 [Patescibacteria group bacterium]